MRISNIRDIISNWTVEARQWCSYCQETFTYSEKDKKWEGFYLRQYIMCPRCHEEFVVNDFDKEFAKEYHIRGE